MLGGYSPADNFRLDKPPASRSAPQESRSSLPDKPRPPSPLVNRHPTTVRMRTSVTSHPLACATPMQTPAICRPAIGRTRGLPGGGGAAVTTFPQFEQNRALGGNPDSTALTVKGHDQPPGNRISIPQYHYANATRLGSGAASAVESQLANYASYRDTGSSAACVRYRRATYSAQLSMAA